MLSLLLLGGLKILHMRLIAACADAVSNRWASLFNASIRLLPSALSTMECALVPLQMVMASWRQCAAQGMAAARLGNEHCCVRPPCFCHLQETLEPFVFGPCHQLVTTTPLFEANLVGEPFWGHVPADKG